MNSYVHMWDCHGLDYHDSREWKREAGNTKNEINGIAQASIIDYSFIAYTDLDDRTCD